MESIQPLPHLLRDLMIREDLGPSQLARQLGIPRSTLSGWLNGRLPNAMGLVLLSRRFPSRELDIIDSYLRWRHARRMEARPDDTLWYEPRREVESLIHNIPVGQDLPTDGLAYLVEVWKRLDADVRIHMLLDDPGPQQSDLLILPAPSAAIIQTWSEVVKVIAVDGERLYSLDWRRFEDLIAHLLEQFGWSIGPLARTKDNGIDILASQILAPDMQFRMLVQCKRYSQSRKVGLEVVREVWATKWQEGMHQAMIATTTEFTRGAKEMAQRWNVELRDHDEIVTWCQQLASP